MQSMRKKLLSLLLAVVMLLQLFPVTALAEDGEDAGEMPQPEETILASEGWEEPVPVGEDESKREENIKQFRMTDGSWLAATYPLAVHYEENGEWVEIDNRLEEKELEYAVPFPEEGLREEEEVPPEEALPEEGDGNEEPSAAEEVTPEETAVEEAPRKRGRRKKILPQKSPQKTAKLPTQKNLQRNSLRRSRRSLQMRNPQKSLQKIHRQKQLRTRKLLRKMSLPKAKRRTVGKIPSLFLKICM